MSQGPTSLDKKGCVCAHARAGMHVCAYVHVRVCAHAREHTCMC